MRIYLLNAPFIPRFSRMARWNATDRGGTTYYPYWLSYATGVLEEIYKDVRLADAPAWKWNLDDTLKDISSFNPNLVVVDSSFSSLSNDINVADCIKRIDKNIITVLVGPPASQFADEILKKDSVDIVARFEYDFTIRDLANAIDKSETFRNITGISYKNGKNIIHNPDRGFLSTEDLDKIPFVSKVYKKHLNLNDYFLAQCLHPVVQIFTGRGCPNLCTFCSWPKTLMGRKYRVRSITNVVDELSYIKNELPKVKEVFIEDDTFTMDKKRVKEICEEILRRKIDLVWSCNARANLDYDTMKLMKKAGCRLLDVGYESANDEILRNIKKGITVNQEREFTINAREAGLMILADFIIGLPGETKETAENSIRFVKEMKPDLMQFSIACPIPGTEFNDWIKKNGYLISNENFLDNEGFQKSVISYPDLTNEEMELFVDRALREYYPSIFYLPIALRAILKRNGLLELKRIIISAKRFAEYIKNKQV